MALIRGGRLFAILAEREGAYYSVGAYSRRYGSLCWENIHRGLSFLDTLVIYIFAKYVLK